MGSSAEKSAHNTVLLYVYKSVCRETEERRGQPVSQSVCECEGARVHSMGAAGRAAEVDDGTARRGPTARRYVRRRATMNFTSERLVD